jgi:hypothetical protein
VVTPVAARSLMHAGGGSTPIAQQTIIGLTLSNSTFLAGPGSANRFIGNGAVQLSPAIPAFNGTYGLSGPDAGKFHIDPVSGALSVGSVDVNPGPFNVSIIPLGAHIGAGRKFQGTLNGTSSAGTSLTTNVSGTRPLGPIFSPSQYGQPGGSNDYPLANVIVGVQNGPGNPGDYLQFYAAAAGGYVGSKWYLNDSPNQPGSGLTTAANLHVPSVQGYPTWNPKNTIPPTPPVTQWQLRFVSGGPSPAAGTVLASQTITINVLKRSNPFFPNLGQISFNSATTVMACTIGSGGIGGASTCPIVRGTIQAQMLFAPSDGSYFPANNTVQIRYTVDDVPVGPIITGPTSVFDRYTYNLDTTTLTEGTHALGAILVDCTSGSATTNSLPYYWRCVQFLFIVHNTAQTLAQIYAGPMLMPSIDRALAPSHRLNASKLDFLTFPGFAGPGGVVATAGTHNTVVPIPAPQSGFIPPASDPSSPMHGLSPDQQRDSKRMFLEGICGASPTEYLTFPRFCITRDGGAYIWPYNLEIGQTLEGDYTQAIRHCNFDGQRNDCQVDQISQAIDGHDGTYFVLFELFGRIVRITHDGTAKTMAGGTTDRTKLGFSSDDNTISEADLNTILTQVGTIGTPSFGDLRGINDGCWDLRDPTPGNSLVVANPVKHYIAKITGLVNGPVVMTRIAGQDRGLGGAQINVADNGGLVDGPATEFVAGASVATFVGSVSGGVLTVVSGYTVTGAGGLQAGCPLSWSPGNLNTTTGNMVTANISGSGNGSRWKVNFNSSGGNQSMTASQSVGLLSGPYSVKMRDGVHGPDPLGTMYIADYQNSAIRRISADGNTLTTLVGNQLGAMRWDSSPGHGPTEINGTPLWSQNNSSTPITISAASWAAGVLTLQTVAPVVAVQVSPNTGTIAPYWTITLAGLTNTGSGGAPAVNGNFQVISVSPGAQQFTLAMPAGAGVIGTLGGFGSANVVFWSDDVYLPSAPGGRSMDHGLPTEAYCPLPQRLVINSTGKLVVVHTWFDAVTTIDLAAGTISYTGQYGCTVKNTRLNPDGTRANPQLNFQISWVGIDVDSGVAGDNSSTGCVGPKDDIFMLDSNGNIIGYYWRMAADGTPIASPLGAGRFSSNDMDRYYPMPIGRQGGGHYSWAVAISRYQGRMLTSGISDSGVTGWRIIDPTREFFPDPASNTFADGGALTRGYVTALQGTVTALNVGTTAIPGVFPWGIRPGITQTHGEIGRSNMGLPGHADTFDGVQQMFPTDDALATFIQSGFGGAVPAPEFTGDDLKDIIYAIRRMSIQGSIPVPISSLVQRAPYEIDVTAPAISSVLATRTGPGATTITVTWETDKPTWGVVAAGFASAHLTNTPYHLFSREAFVAGPNNPSYKTVAHSVTIDVFQDVLTYLIVIAKDIAGNNVISAEQTVNA